MMVEKRKLSIREKADYIPAFLSIGGTAVTAPITGQFRGNDGADTLKHHVAYALIRKFNSRLNSLQSQSFQPAFPNLCQKFCKNKALPYDAVTTKSGVRGAWVGDKKTAKYVIVYYHGGGFALAGSDGHLDFWYEVQQHLQRAKIPVAFFFVFYTLTPHAVYPTQFKESVEAVQYVVEEVGRRPSEILLAGDSAGGNLAAAVLLHLSHPCPEIPAYSIDEKLKGLVLMAPWVSLDVTWPSFQANKHKDYLEAAVEGRWAKEYVMAHEHDAYTDPEKAPAEWWKDAKAEKILVTYGSIEALSDGIRSWTDKYNTTNTNLDVVIGKDEVHIAPIVWPMFGDRHETEQGKAIKTWMQNFLD